MVWAKKSIFLIVSYFAMLSLSHSFDLTTPHEPFMTNIWDVNWAFLGKRSKHLQNYAIEKPDNNPSFGLKFKIKMDFLSGINHNNNYIEGFNLASFPNEKEI